MSRIFKTYTNLSAHVQIPKRYTIHIMEVLYHMGFGPFFHIQKGSIILHIVQKSSSKLHPKLKETHIGSGVAQENHLENY